jgi:hypothetical protein
MLKTCDLTPADQSRFCRSWGPDHSMKKPTRELKSRFHGKPEMRNYAEIYLDYKESLGMSRSSNFGAEFANSQLVGSSLSIVR